MAELSLEGGFKFGEKGLKGQVLGREGDISQRTEVKKLNNIRMGWRRQPNRPQSRMK